MAISLGISRDVQVSYPIQEVKSAIEKVSAASKSLYQIENRDDVMNTFSIALIGGLAVIVPVTLQLKKVSDNETQIVLTSNKATNSGNQANSIVDKFMGLISKALSGDVLDEKSASKGKSGCFGATLLLGGIIIGVFFLFLS